MSGVSVRGQNESKANEASTISKDSQPLFFGKSILHSRLPPRPAGSSSQVNSNVGFLSTQRDNPVAEENSLAEADDLLFESIVNYKDFTFDSKIRKHPIGVEVTIKQRNGDMAIISEMDDFECSPF